MYIDEIKDLIKDLEKILEKNNKWYKNGDNLLRKKIKRIGKEKIVPMYSYFPIQTQNPFVDEEHNQKYTYEEDKKEVLFQEKDSFNQEKDSFNQEKEYILRKDNESFTPPIVEKKEFEPKIVEKEFIPRKDNETKTFNTPIFDKKEFEPKIMKKEFIPRKDNETKKFNTPIFDKKEFEPKIVKKEYTPPPIKKDFNPQFIEKPKIVEFKTESSAKPDEINQPQVSKTIERQIKTNQAQPIITESSFKTNLVNKIEDAKEDLISIEKANETADRLKNLTKLIF